MKRGGDHMNARLTGITTPFGGVSWEYKTTEEKVIPRPIYPGQKIQVFISSICGKEKYDKVRADLKSAIEATQLAEVYTFEGKGASTLSAGAHYKLALKDSDLCIFLIDNADGIGPGVQAEIDIVRKHRIKALYYFCDETKKEKTALEQSLMGAHFSKSKTVHSFSELSQDGAQALIDDIITIYHYYCRGRIVLQAEENDEMQEVEITNTEKYQIPTIPKTTLKNVDKCRDYILKFVLGYPYNRFPYETLNTSEFDEWGIQFLQILFEGKSIKYFNVAMYLEILKEQQDKDYFPIVQIRWQAIQSYYAGDVERCMGNLEEALALAKKSRQPTWVIKDILIDLRNQHWTLCGMQNRVSDEPAQAELSKSNEEIYYPVLDRVRESLNEKYIEGLYKKKTESPYSISLGSNLERYGEMLASSLIVAMYNGSLSHILMIYKEIRNFIFYLSCKYDDWNLRLNLYKLAIFTRKEKEIKGIQNSYPEVLSKMTSNEALSIMEFCSNHPIEYERLSSQLLAFGAVGYFLDDENFEHYQNLRVEKIQLWLADDNAAVDVGRNIFKCLSGVAYRMPQDILSEICCQFIEKHYSRWYIDIFKFIATNIDLQKMSDESAKKLVKYINNVLADENEREQIKYAPDFLYVLRKQNRILTDDIDKNVAVHFCEYYENVYKLETTENVKTDMPEFIKKFTVCIKKSNETQGKGGNYFDRGIREIATVRSILMKQGFKCDSETMNTLISTIIDTILISKEDISVKLDAITLLICIAIRYPEDYMRNKNVYKKLVECQDTIEMQEHPIMMSNIDNISLKIGLQFLYAAMGKDVYGNILELMPYLQGDITTTIAVTKLIARYLESTDTALLPDKVEGIVLQHILQWIHSDYIDIRWYATHILLAMARNRENYGIVNHQLVDLIDSNNVYIKCLIMRNIYKIDGITDETKEYIVNKCKHDPNFVVRMVCKEIEDKSL